MAQSKSPPCIFVTDWLQSDPSKRLFIAFTKSDIATAEKVRKALEREGYVVFTFLKEGSDQPWVDEALVGEVFAQASHRLVLDTANARGSQGVEMESRLCEFLLSTGPPRSRWADLIKEAG